MSRHTRVLLCAVALSGAFLVCTQAASAGVIVWKEIPGHDHVIEIVQGHKEWLASGRDSSDISHGQWRYSSLGALDRSRLRLQRCAWVLRIQALHKAHEP